MMMMMKKKRKKKKQSLYSYDYEEWMTFYGCRRAWFVPHVDRDL